MTPEEIVADQYEKYKNLSGDIMKFVGDVTKAQGMPLELGILALSIASSTGIRATALQRSGPQMPPSFWLQIETDLRKALAAVEGKV